MLGNTLELEALYPTAMSPTLSMAALPIQRKVLSGENVPCWKTEKVPEPVGVRLSSYQRTPVKGFRLVVPTCTEWLTTSDSWFPAKFRYANRYISRSPSESSFCLVLGC